MTVIPCVTWVSRGKSKSKPEKIQIEEADLKRIIEETEERLENEEEASSEDETENNVPGAIGGAASKRGKTNRSEASEVDVALSMASSLKKGKKKKKNRPETTETKDKPETTKTEEPDDFEAKYNMDNYDNEEYDTSNLLKGIGNLTVYASNTEDPYIEIKNDSSDDEDFEIKSTDNLLVVAKAESDCCSMEVHVYNSELDNLYCHHELLLSSFPLAVEWMDYDLRDGNTGNYVAVASMDPTIDVWDLDLVDSLEPMAILGQKPSKKKKKKQDIPSHTDAVLDLSWNPLARHVLASASADFTVGLWDLTEGKLAVHIKQHKEKVQCVKWHPVEEHMLLSGSFDHTVKVYDCRSPDSSNKTWDLGGEIEKLLWNKHSPMNFFASTDSGHVYYMDSRQDKAVYTLAAHKESVTGLSQSPNDAKMLVTTSADGTMKVWDIENDKPSMISSQSLKMGQLLCLDSCLDESYVFAVGGEKRFKVWDLRDIKDVFSHFCGSNEEYIPDTRPEEKEDTEAAVEMEELTVDMETESTSQSQAISASANNSSVKKKKTKKKKKKKMEV